MRVIELLIIWTAIFLIVFTISYASYSYNVESINESPYNKCIDGCNKLYTSQMPDCIKTCGGILICRNITKEGAKQNV